MASILHPSPGCVLLLGEPSVCTMAVNGVPVCTPGVIAFCCSASEPCAVWLLAVLSPEVPVFCCFVSDPPCSVAVNWALCSTAL